jgi:hypothetical protein
LFSRRIQVVELTFCESSTSVEFLSALLPVLR